eukprot:GHVU01018519.1.p1 GENE.GHVU01018519.1~~GHVU01018519.1.p1  ORF type:complete len:117 (+),score=9.87 GHVU01018519.1:410-760(+)
MCNRQETSGWLDVSLHWRSGSSLFFVSGRNGSNRGIKRRFGDRMVRVGNKCVSEESNGRASEFGGADGQRRLKRLRRVGWRIDTRASAAAPTGVLIAVRKPEENENHQSINEPIVQ